MAGDLNKPVVTDTYANWSAEIIANFSDQSKLFDPALSLGTANIPDGAKRWNGSTNKWEKKTAGAWGDLCTTYAIGVSTAQSWATARTISVSGDATGTSAGFDGSANCTFAVTLANSGISAGDYNNSATQVRPLTVDTKGRITAAPAALTITPAWGSVTGKPTTLTGYGVSSGDTLFDAVYQQISGMSSYAQMAQNQSWTKGQRGAVSACGNSGATVTLDLNNGNNFSITANTASWTLANPTNIVAGQSGIIAVTQDATGSRVIAWGAYWVAAGGTKPVLSTAANAIDLLSYYVIDATHIFVSAIKGVA